MREEVKSGTVALPVTVLTGFLGSGKTTLLNRLLGESRQDRMAVIVNEFGAVALDNLLVETVDEELVLLGSGCVCCSVRGDLVDTLLDLKSRVEQGDIPRFERVLLETSGLSDPAPIMHALMTQPSIAGAYYFDSLVTVVDAEHGSETLRQYPEAIKQVAFADRLVMTKTDIASGEQATRVRAQVLDINPGMDVVDAQSEAFSTASVFGVGLYDAALRRADPERWLHSAAVQLAMPHRHASGIESYCIERDRPMNRAVLGMWLSELVRDHGNLLLRIKGIVQVDDTPGPLVVHGVQHRFYPPLRLAEWPSADHHSRVVFIVRGLARPVVEDLLADIERRLAWPGG